MAVEHFGPIAELETNEAVIDTVPHAALVPPYATTGTDVFVFVLVDVGGPNFTAKSVV